jgi:hypothetical protein
MHTSIWHGKSGGHGLSMQSSVCLFSIGYFGADIIGLIETDTESPATAHYHSKPSPGAFRRTTLERPAANGSDSRCCDNCSE